MKSLQLTEFDRFIYENEIQPYLPQRIFDAHNHVLISKFHPNLEKVLPLSGAFSHVELPVVKDWWKTVLPDAETNGLVFGFPTPNCDMKGENDYLANAMEPGLDRFSLLVHPDMADADLEKDIVRYRPAGLKPYLIFARNAKPAEAAITDFIPEAQIALANKYGLAITLHVSKTRGMADEDNLNDIIRLTKEYPKCQFILAHCGRCFITPNMKDALKKLPVCDNLWLDTSAVCDLGVFLYLFDQYDRTKILFGMDGVSPVAFRGSYVRLGMGWHVCMTDHVRRPGGQDINNATIAAYESLCAMLHAANFCKLSDKELNDLFFENAAGLFNLCP